VKSGEDFLLRFFAACQVRRIKLVLPDKASAIIATKNLTAIGTLIERTTGYTMLVHLPDGYKAEQIRDALAAKIQTLPDRLRASLT
jgi:hypothetical protein